MKNRGFFKYIIAFAFITIIHLITYNQFGYYVDEIGACYDAYCISEYGVDRWCDSFPIYFRAYGDGQNALYTYMMALVFKIFGYSKFVIRCVPLIFSIVTSYFLSKINNLVSEKQGKLSLFLYAVLPIFTMLFQLGLESHLMLTFSAIFMYYLLKGTKTHHSIISGIMAGLVFYTYALSYIVVPLFIILYFGILLCKKEIKIRQVIAFCVPAVIMGIPLLLMQIFNMMQIGEVKIGFITFPDLYNYRIYELSLRGFFKKIYNAFIQTNFYDGVPHNSSAYFGSMYYISIPFVLYGFYKSVKNMKTNKVALAMILWTICMYGMSGILSEDANGNITRLNSLFMSKLYFLCVGLLNLKLGRNTKQKTRKCIYGAYAILSSFFLIYYIGFYDLESQSGLYREDYGDLPNVEEDICVPDNYIYFIWSKKISPYDFNIKENGYKQYKNYHIGYSSYTSDKMMLVYKNDNISIQSLKSIGVENKLELDNYYLYLQKGN